MDINITQTKKKEHINLYKKKKVIYIINNKI